MQGNVCPEGKGLRIIPYKESLILYCYLRSKRKVQWRISPHHVETSSRLGFHSSSHYSYTTWTLHFKEFQPSTQPLIVCSHQWAYSIAFPRKSSWHSSSALAINSPLLLSSHLFHPPRYLDTVRSFLSLHTDNRKSLMDMKQESNLNKCVL